MSVRTIVRAVVPLVVVMTTATAAFGAVPDTWTPVKDNPNVNELFPSLHGGFFGWAKSSLKNPEHFNFFVERKDGTRVKVNAAGTQGLAGDIAGHSVFYLQQLGDRPPRIQRYDLRTGKRSSLPAKVNRGRTTIRTAQPDEPLAPAGGYLTASGPWLLYGGKRSLGPDSYPAHSIMLYNRVTRELREVTWAQSDWHDYFPGQVNGRYVVWAFLQYDDYSSSVARYDIKTKQIEELVPDDDGDLTRKGVSVSTDGTVYYFEGQIFCAGEQCSWDLVRRSPDGTTTVLASVPAAAGVPGQTYVKDRPDGSHVVYLSWYDEGPRHDHDIYRLVDDPQG